MRIQIEGLSKSFGSLQVLRGIDMDIPAGELCMILGASGTGKSVLLKHLVGLLQPDSGSIRIDGQDIVGLSEGKLMDLRPRFGMIFQNAGLLQSLTVGENVGLPLLELTDTPPDEVKRIVAEKLEMVGLKDRADQSPSTLSGGQKKRAAIARALTTNADCLLFDEPTAGLDPIISSAIDDVIREVNEKTGATCLIVTHDLASVFAIGQSVYMLHEGQVIAHGKPDELRSSSDERVQHFLARDGAGVV